MTMPTLSRTTLSLAVAALGVLVAETASAQDRVCRGVLGRVLADNVTVPAGATCALRGTLVRGDVVLGRGSSLNADRAIVFGSIKGDGSRMLLVAGQTRVAGSIEWKLSGEAMLLGALIDGDIKLEENTGRLTAIENVVQGDIQVEKNRSVIVIQGNRVDGNLKCHENVPAPTGSRNTVAGNKEGQCARL
jgi:hypothetical protein